MIHKSFLLLLSGVCCVALVCSCATKNDDLYFGACPDGLIETPNSGNGGSVICCPEGSLAQDGLCVDAPASMEAAPNAEPAPENVVSEGVAPQAVTTTQPETPAVAEPVKAEKKVSDPRPERFVFLTAPEGKGNAYCPERANSLAWNGSEFQCCGRNMKSVVVPSRKDSLCCPSATIEARWIGEKWNDYECCPEGLVETKNTGDGDKYICCKKGEKALNGKCSKAK